MGPDLSGCRPEADKVLGWLASPSSLSQLYPYPLTFPLTTSLVDRLVSEGRDHGSGRETILEDLRVRDLPRKPLPYLGRFLVPVFARFS